MKRIQVVCALIAAIACVTESAAVTLWQDYPGLQGPGHTGILIGDFNGDGAVEAAVSAFSIPGYASNGLDLLGVLSNDVDGLRVRHVSVFPGEKFIGSLISGPSEAGSDQVVAVLGPRTFSTAPNRIVILGEVPLRILRSIPAPGVVAVTDVGDVDADGDLEILGLASTSSWSDAVPVVLDHATGAVEWTGSTAARDMKAVQLDADPALELVLAATPGRIIDGASHAVEWTWPAGFGERILVGRFAAATTSTFAINSSWSGYVQVFRGQPFSPISEFTVNQVSAAAVIRMNGADQIGIGDGQWGSIHVYDPRTGTSLFSAPNPEHGVSALAGGDLDGDSSVEVVFGAGLTSSGADVLRVVDTTSTIDKFNQIDEVGPHVAIARGDFSGTGRDEVAYLTTASRSNYDGPNLHVLDAANGRRLRSRMAAIMSWDRQIPHVATLQADADPQVELVVASSHLYTPTVFVVDGATLQNQWSVPIDDGGSVASMDVIDFDGNGMQDIVVAVTTGFVRVLDGTNGTTLWQSVTIPGTNAPMLAAFHSATGQPHLVLARDRGVYVFNLTSGLVEVVAKPSVNSSALTRWGEGNDCHIGLLGADGTLRTFGCLDLDERGQRVLPPDTLFFRPLDESGNRFVAASGGVMYLVDAIGWMPLSAMLGDQLGYGNRGLVMTLPGGSVDDVFIGSQHMVSRVRIDLRVDPIFATGFD